MITNQILKLTILPATAHYDKITLEANNDGTTELTVKGEKIVLRTAALIALGRELEAVYPHAANETRWIHEP